MNTPNATCQAVGRSAQALRRAELAQIHIAKAQLGLSEDDYRLLLRTVTGKDSASELDWRGRAALLAHFKKLVFKSGGRDWVKERGAVKDGTLIKGSEMTSKPIFIQLTCAVSAERGIIYINTAMIVMVVNNPNKEIGETLVMLADGMGDGPLYVKETPQQIMELIKNA